LDSTPPPPLFEFNLNVSKKFAVATKTLVPVYQTAWLQIPEDSKHNIQQGENHRSHVLISLFVFQFLSEIVSLCMQSPTEVVTKILHEGLTNSKQVPLMVEVLEYLNPILSVCELDKMTAASGNKKMSTVTSLLSSVMKNDLSDLEKSNFVNLVRVICFYYRLSVN
jgi:hypothetical protein